GTKSYIILVTHITSVNSAFGTGIAANLMPYISREFNIPNGPQQVLASSLFLLGFVFGPLVFAPLSEEYGRKPILLIGSIGFAAWNMGSALSPNWMALLVFRFLAGTFGAPPLSVVGGILADIYPDKMKRGRLLGGLLSLGLSVRTDGDGHFEGPLLVFHFTISHLKRLL
ncbi:hypothetical protein F66182_18601, partial [Fusarium sp. NRRL 66182]